MGGHGGLGQQLGNDGTRLFDLVALLLERLLHADDSVRNLGGLKAVEVLNSLGDCFEVIGALIVLRTAVLELFFEFGGIEFSLEHALHSSLRDVLLLGLGTSSHGSEDGIWLWSLAIVCVFGFEQLHMSVSFNN